MKTKPQIDVRWYIVSFSLLLMTFVIVSCGSGNANGETTRIENEIADMQATVVAVQSEIADMKATVQTLKTKDATATPATNITQMGVAKVATTRTPTPIQPEAVKATATQVPTATQIPTPTPDPSLLRFFVIKARIEDAGNGWSNHEYDLGVYSDGYQPSHYIPYTVITKEGFTYQGTLESYLFRSVNRFSIVLPDHFSIRYFDLEKTAPYSLRFQASTSSTPESVVFADAHIAPINLQPESFVEYTTDRTDDVLQFPVNIRFEDTGELTYTDASLSRSSGQWYLNLHLSFENLSRGYDTFVQTWCSLYQIDGGFSGGENSSADVGPATAYELTHYIWVPSRSESSLEVVSLLNGALIFCAARTVDHDEKQISRSFVARLPTLEDGK